MAILQFHLKVYSCKIESDTVLIKHALLFVQKWMIWRLKYDYSGCDYLLCLLVAVDLALYSTEFK